MAFRPRWTTIPSSTLATTLTNTANISPLVTSFASRETYRSTFKHPRALDRAQDFDIGYEDDSSGEAQASSSDSGSTTDWFANNPYSSLTNCDARNLFCAVGTCYSGVNGYIGCCTVSSCAARTTCIPYHSGQKSCNEDTEGCVFCSNPATPYCYHFENWGGIPTMFAMWCTNSPSATIVFYSNIVAYPSIDDLPSITFTPSWPATLTSAANISTTVPLASSFTDAPAGGANIPSAGDPSSDDVSSNSGVNLPIGEIAGIAVGGAIVLALIVAIVVFLILRKKKRKSRKASLMQQPRGTLGGAVLPGTWFGGNESGIQNDTRGHLATSDSIRLAQQPESSTKHSTGQELDDTAVPPYSLELGNTGTTSPTATPFNTLRQAIRVRPGFAPYSPMNIILPGSPYTNHQASYSDPVLGNRQELQRSGEMYQDLHGHIWTHNDHNQSRVRDSTHVLNLSSNPANIGQTQLPVISQTLSQSSSITTPSGIVSPLMSTSTTPRTPLFPQLSSLQSGANVPNSSAEQHDSLLAEFNEQGSQSPRHENCRNDFIIDRSTSLSSHPSHGGFMSPPQQLSESAAPGIVLSSVDTIKPSASSSLYLGKNTRLSPERLKGSQPQDFSARGSWSTWVSPEAAYAEGLWEDQSSSKERQYEAADIEQNKKEKKD